MAWFWIAAAALAGGAALLVMLFARRAVSGRLGENPTLTMHRRQLAEIDDLADRGLIGDGDKAAARAEAGRRLLSTAALGATPETIGSNTSRLIAAGAAVAAGAVALILYMLLGAPGAPDQPYRARVAAWKAGDPAALDAPRMAAVLNTIVAERPNDPQGFSFLGRAQMAAGDPFAAEKSFAHAAELAPSQADYQVQIGEARLGAADGAPSPDAVAAFRQALALDPRNLAARFALGRLDMLSGDRAAGLDLWRGILGDIPAGDPRRIAFAAEIDRIASGGPIDPPTSTATAPTSSADPAPFIRAMVAGLAAKLAANPDDPEGWARLVRSYGVLHDAPAQADALAKARRQFAGKPDKLAPIEAEAKAHPAG